MKSYTNSFVNSEKVVYFLTNSLTRSSDEPTSSLSFNLSSSSSNDFSVVHPKEIREQKYIPFLSRQIGNRICQSIIFNHNLIIQHSKICILRRIFIKYKELCQLLLRYRRKTHLFLRSAFSLSFNITTFFSQCLSTKTIKLVSNRFHLNW